jgi:Bacterial SH3 domain
MKRKLLVAVPLLCLVALAAWMFRPKHEPQGEAFVSGQSIALLSSVAQVRQDLGLLHYGDRVDTLGHRNGYVKVRAPSGAIGWVNARSLIAPEVWNRSQQLLKQVEGLPVQAEGKTKVATNLRVAPGRTSGRLYQFTRGTPVEVVGRAVANWVQVTDDKEPEDAPKETKKEDWFLVRAVTTRPPGEDAARGNYSSATSEPGDQSVPIAGWVVARFIELDVPDAIREGANAANLRPIAWFELNRVADPTGEKPQYLLAAARGPEGQPCDFTNLRVYTWNGRRSRYETAFIDNDVCGKLPILVGKNSAGQPEFRFHMMDTGEERGYRLMQTVVRRIREEGEGAGKKPSTSKNR